MGKFFDNIQPQHREFIRKQHLFFVATAPLGAEAHVNLSPKSMEGFRVLSESKVAYLDLIGSGNETSAHLLENGRITFMFCAFEGPPNILRLYGKGRVILPDTADWAQYASEFDLIQGMRQIILADVHKVQTSCGYGVPRYEYVAERSIYQDWAAKKGAEGLRDYVREKNSNSMDGLPTDWGLALK
jgi:Pyridoxamine 5'-phosphate oxidase